MEVAKGPQNTMRTSRDTQRLLLTLSTLVATSFASIGVAHAQKSAAVAPISTAPSTAEVTYDLGNYDASTTLHPSYGIIKDQAATFILADPNQSYDPCPAPSPTYDWDRVFSKQDEFGNSTFGAGYWGGLTFSSRAGRAGGPDTFTGEALLRGYVTVFDNDYELVRIRGTASLVGTQGSSSYVVRVLATDVRSGSASGNLTGTETYQNTFIKKSKMIWLGPIPVTFTGSINGTLNLDYRAEYAMSTISLNAKPKGRIYAEATAAVDAWLASAGVTGTLTLIQAEVPSRAQVIVGPNTLAYGMDSSLLLSSLSGTVDAWAHIPGKTWRMRLASWSPLYNGTFPIVHVSSCQNPIVRPVCGDQVCQSGESHDNCPSDCAAPPPPPPETDPRVPVYCLSKPWMCSDI